MSTMKTLFDKLSSNFMEVGNVSQYFDQGTVCSGGNKISELKSEIVNYRKNVGECIGSTCWDSICFPNPNSVSDYGIVNDVNSNQIMLSTLLQGKGFQGIYNAVKCNGLYNVVYDVYPMGLQYPSKIPNNRVGIEELNRPSAKPIGSKVLTVTPGISFIVGIIEDICKILTDAYDDFAFNHGNLTHESIGFDKQGKVVLCDLRYASMSIQSNGHIVRISPKVNVLKKFFRGDFIPNSDSGFYSLDNNTKNMNGIEQYRSLDYYTFIVSCLTIDYIFDTVMSNYVLKAIIFDSIFDTSDISKVYDILYKYVKSGKTIPYVEILNLLRTCKLRCNAIELTMERMSKLKNIIN